MSDRVRNLRLKAAFRELVAAAGGQERAAKLAGVCQQTVSRWGNPGTEDFFPPLDAVAVLEEETGCAAVTEVLADLSGRVAVPKAAADACDEGLAKLVGTVAKESGDVIVAVGGALADGTMSADEAQAALPEVREAQAALHTIEKSLKRRATGAKPRLVR